MGPTACNQTSEVSGNLRGLTSPCHMPQVPASVLLVARLSLGCPQLLSQCPESCAINVKTTLRKRLRRHVVHAFTQLLRQGHEIPHVGRQVSIVPVLFLNAGDDLFPRRQSLPRSALNRHRYVSPSSSRLTERHPTISDSSFEYSLHCSDGSSVI